MSLENSFTEILSAIGEDLTREGLQDTPKRAAKALQYLTKGYNQDVNTVVNGALYKSSIDELVVIKNIELYSLCEHHLLPFIGKCHIGYVPDGQVLGLSKAARLVEVFSRRLQIQENLTKQIADSILEVTKAKGVGVIIEAKHLCMMMRGVEKQSSVMSTSMMLGLLRNNEKTRAEFLQLVRMQGA